MGCFTSKIYLAVLLIILQYVHIIDSAILQCYKCLAVPPTYYTNETIRLCKDFDYSDKFIVNCPYSTFCMKRVTSARIPNLTINGTERDCASQKLETQNYRNQKWYPEITIEEPYTEGCGKLDDKGARTTTTEHCYCKGYLCNSAKIVRYTDFNILLAVIPFCLRYYFYSYV